jgi:hypothetical protein
MDGTTLSELWMPVAQATIPDDRVEQHRTVYGDRRYFGGFTTIYVTWLPCVAG